MIPFYPSGPAGAGLLTLRISVAVSLLVVASEMGQDWAKLAALVAAAALIIGVQTRIVAAITLLAPIFTWSGEAQHASLSLVHAINVAALMLLGPGALSADAALFGRQRVRLPNSDPTSR